MRMRRLSTTLLIPLLLLSLMGAKGNCDGKREVSINTSDNRVYTTKNKVIVYASDVLIIRSSSWNNLQKTVATAFVDGVISESVSDTFRAIDINVLHTGNILADSLDLWAIAKLDGDEISADNSIKLILKHSNEVANLLKQGVDLAAANGVDVPEWNIK